MPALPAGFADLVFGVSPLVIGLTLVGLGTSTPEPVTSIQAALRGAPGVAVGNVVGSNICSILSIPGITALVQPIEVSQEVARTELWVVAAATAPLLAVAITDWRIARREGALMVAGCGGYLAYLVANV